MTYTIPHDLDNKTYFSPFCHHQKRKRINLKTGYLSHNSKNMTLNKENHSEDTKLKTVKIKTNIHAKLKKFKTKTTIVQKLSKQPSKLDCF